MHEFSLDNGGFIESCVCLFPSVNFYLLLFCCHLKSWLVERLDVLFFSFIFSSSFFLFGGGVDGRPALSCTVELVGEISRMGW